MHKNRKKSKTTMEKPHKHHHLCLWLFSPNGNTSSSSSRSSNRELGMETIFHSYTNILSFLRRCIMAHLLCPASHTKSKRWLRPPLVNQDLLQAYLKLKKTYKILAKSGICFYLVAYQNYSKGRFTPWTMKSDHGRWPFSMVQCLNFFIYKVVGPLSRWKPNVDQEERPCFKK